MNESLCKSSGKVYSLVLYLHCNQSQKEKPFKFLLHTKKGFIQQSLKMKIFRFFFKLSSCFLTKSCYSLVFELALALGGKNLVLVVSLSTFWLVHINYLLAPSQTLRSGTVLMNVVCIEIKMSSLPHPMMNLNKEESSWKC